MTDPNGIGEFCFPETLNIEVEQKKLTVSFRGSQYTHLVLHVPPKSK